MKFLKKYVWPWKRIADLERQLGREMADHAATKHHHRMALATIKEHEDTRTKTDVNMRKMARIITLTSGFGK